MFSFRAPRLTAWILLLTVVGASSAHGEERPAWWAQIAPAFEALANAPGGRAVAAERDRRTAIGRATGAPMDPMLEVGVAMWPVGGDPAMAPMAELPMIGIRQRWTPVGLGAERRRGQWSGEAAAAAAEANFNMLALRLAALAFEVARWQAELAVIDRARAWLQVVAATAASRYGEGKGDAREAARLKADLAALDGERAVMAARLSAADAEWAATVPGTVRPLLDGPPASSTATWQPGPVTTAVAASPALRAAKAESEAAGAELARQRGAWVPEIELGVRYGVRTGMDALSAMIGVGVPIWGARRQAPQVDAARAGLAAAEAEQAGRQLDLESRLAGWSARLAAQRAREYSRRQVELPALATARTATWEAYRAGNGDLIEVLDAAEREWMSERMLAVEVSERRMLEANWLAVAGRLMPRKDMP